MKKTKRVGFSGRKHSQESKEKMSASRLGRPAWNKGLKGFRSGEKRPNVLPKGPDNGSWKGDSVGYRGLHIWVQLVLGKPDTCVLCKKKGTGHAMHWANISGEYKRLVSDWVRLCPKCHKEFDMETIAYKRLKKIGL